MTSSVKITACGLSRGKKPTLNSLKKWLRANNPSMDVKSIAAKYHDEDGTIQQNMMFKYVTQQLKKVKDELDKDGACCAKKVVCVFFGKAVYVEEK